MLFPVSLSPYAPTFAQDDPAPTRRRCINEVALLMSSPVAPTIYWGSPFPFQCVLWRGAQLRHACSIRPTIAGLLLVRCFVATHRRRVEDKAGVILHALARGAAARRRRRCLAGHAHAVETRALPFIRDDPAAGTTAPGETNETSISPPPEEITSASKGAAPTDVPTNIERGDADLSFIGEPVGSSSPTKTSMEDGTVSVNSTTSHGESVGSSSPKKKRLSAAERFKRRKERNISKRESRKNESGGARRAGYKLEPYSSDIWDDEMVGAGRGCAPGGISVSDEVSQETTTRDKCMVEPIEPIVAPPETSDAVLATVESKPGRGKKVRSRKLDRFRCTIQEC